MAHWLTALWFSSSAIAFGQHPTVLSGNVIRHEDFQSRYVKPRHVEVWLPKNYSPEKKYAVLYMQDGQMLFDASTTWNGQEWGIDETVTQLSKNKKVKPLIVVGIWNGGPARHTEYCPQKPVESLSDEQRDQLFAAVRPNGATVFSGPVVSDNYLKFIVHELKPFIDSTYATHPQASSTFIGGSSMGGLISWYALCEYPDVFGGAACLSTHWPGIFTMENNPLPEAFFNYLTSHLPDPKSHKVYFDFGTTTLDALYEPLQIRVDEIMKARGYSKANWITLKFEGEPHSEEAWRKRFSKPLQFLLGR